MTSGAVQAALAAEIQTYAKQMKLPTVAKECEVLAATHRRSGADPLAFLRDLLAAEHRDRGFRSAARRVQEARFPLVKTLDGFDFARNPHLDEGRIRALATGAFVAKGEPVLLIGGTGTGKTHLATAIGHEACAQGIATRFVTAAALVNELTEAAESRTLSRVVARYARVELLILDELGYLPLSPVAAQLLFQVVAERGERKATLVTTNLPFGEWTTMIQDPRLCRAFVERLTFRAHIVETGERSVRLEEALAASKRQKGAKKMIN